MTADYNEPLLTLPHPPEEKDKVKVFSDTQASAKGGSETTPTSNSTRVLMRDQMKFSLISAFNLSLQIYCIIIFISDIMQNKAVCGGNLFMENSRDFTLH